MLLCCFLPPVSSWYPPSYWKACRVALSLLPPDYSNDHIIRAWWEEESKTTLEDNYHTLYSKNSGVRGIPLLVVQKHLIEGLCSKVEDRHTDIVQQFPMGVGQILQKDSTKYVNQADIQNLCLWADVQIISYSYLYVDEDTLYFTWLKKPFKRPHKVLYEHNCSVMTLFF